MSVLLTVALAAATHFQPSCSWDRPGVNPYTGSSVAAIERYTDIPEQVRNTLKRRIAENQSDDQVRITRDAIIGKNRYAPGIRDMHFGAASVCASVTRNKWSEQRQEPGAVYCVGEHCILVPRICGNISRITRLPTTPTAAAPAAQASRMGDPLDGRNPGLADVFPDLEEKERADEDGETQERERAREKRTAVYDAIAQAEASNNDREHGYLWGHGPTWEHDDSDDSTGPYIPASPVPEADSWAMLLAGLAVVGALARRRARRCAAH